MEASEDVSEDHGGSRINPGGGITRLGASMANDDRFNGGGANKEVANWTEPLTVRALVVGVATSVLFIPVIIRQNIKSGVAGPVDAGAAVTAFLLLKGWTYALGSLRLLGDPLSPQESVVVQAFAIGACNVAYLSGFGDYIMAMSRTAAHPPMPLDKFATKEPKVSWLIPLFLVISSAGYFAILPFTKALIARQRLTFPTGFAMGHLIKNTFVVGSTDATWFQRTRAIWMMKWFGFSFLLEMAKWCLTNGPACGLRNFPVLGLAARSRQFGFNFDARSFAVGAISRPNTAYSAVVGSLIAALVLKPNIEAMRGVWYHHPQDYKIYTTLISVSLLVGNGLFHLFYAILQTLFVNTSAVSAAASRRYVVPYNDGAEDLTAEDEAVDGGDSSPAAAADDDVMTDEERIQSRVFLSERIPEVPVAVGGLLANAGVTLVALPIIFPGMPRLPLAAVYAAVPVFAFSNAYGVGCVDFTLSDYYGKASVFLFAALATGGSAAGGEQLVGLVACGVATFAAQTAASLMHGMKAGFLTLTPRRTVLAAMIAGTVLGCFLSPAFLASVRRHVQDSAGAAAGDHPTSMSLLAAGYRALAAASAADGAGGLPRHCLRFSATAFMAAVGLNVAREVARSRGWEYAEYVPSAAAMSVMFVLPGSAAMDMAAGMVAMWAWRRRGDGAGREAEEWAPAMVAALVCGEAAFMLPRLAMEFAGVNPPMCLSVYSSEVYGGIKACLDNVVECKALG